jgi:hypothetical protein
MKPIVFIFLTLHLGIWKASSQAGLHISAGTELFIGGGTIFSTDSLVLIPDTGFSVTGQNSLTRNSSVAHSTANPYVNRVFHLSSTSSPFTGTIGIFYRDEELNGIAENVLVLNVHNGTSWTAFNNNVTRDATANSLTTSGLANLLLNELTLASLSSPLPLTYISFNGLCDGNTANLTWKTAQEFNTSYFEIERSNDSRVWQTVGNIPAAGYSAIEQTYTWSGYHPASEGFYRITEYDLDGRKTTSSVIRIFCSSLELFAVFPNPVQNSATIRINVNESARVTLSLYDAKGAMIKQIEMVLSRGTNLLQYDMANLAAGTYSMIARWNNTIKTVKIIKQ